MRRLLFVVALMLTACATGRPGYWSETCGEPPPNAESFTVDRIPWMVGSFRLTLVTTSFDAPVTRNELDLFAVDSATRERARTSRIGHRPRRDVRLIGADYWARRRSPVAAEWDDGILYLGCRDCFDGSPDKLTIGAVSENGFWGWWRNDQSGIARVVDRHGKALPDPAGYFCARRIR